ncbi:unnamed protein product [Rodentolepis nana]|uniref:Mitochondrial import inner membrane translocase subunit Tim21 n=1 Tax=Rodentolepis nana TaxID=102285 RepID=A0A0R3T8U7_RODNA|nr:unnamed protein product [Rodentolepis nana]
MALAQKLFILNRTALRRSLIYFSTSHSLLQNSTHEAPKKVVSRAAVSNDPALSVTSKVKQGASDFWYSTIVVGGIALTGFIFYIIGNELFSSKSPTRVYEDALKICISDHRVQDLLGTSITGYGEVNRRGRGTQIASSEWIDTHGKKHLTMRFHLKGAYATGTVHLELYENDCKEMVYRYLVVEVDGLTRRQVILRPEENTSSSSFSVQPPAPPPVKLEPFNEKSE